MFWFHESLKYPFPYATPISNKTLTCSQLRTWKGWSMLRMKLKQQEGAQLERASWDKAVIKFIPSFEYFVAAFHLPHHYFRMRSVLWDSQLDHMGTEAKKRNRALLHHWFMMLGLGNCLLVVHLGDFWGCNHKLNPFIWPPSPIFLAYWGFGGQLVIKSI